VAKGITSGGTESESGSRTIGVPHTRPHLANHGETWLHAVPFVFLTVLFLALPALAVLILGQRAEAQLPKVRDWMDENSWIVSEVVLVFFIAIVLLG
jgi:hypothetical protein